MDLQQFRRNKCCFSQVGGFLKRSFTIFTDKVVNRSTHLDGHNAGQHFLFVQERRLDG